MNVEIGKKNYKKPLMLSLDGSKSGAIPAIVGMAAGYAAGRAVTNAMKVQIEAVKLQPLERVCV